MSILSDLFHGGKNPADAASPYLNQIPGVGKNLYKPYIHAGREAGDITKGEYENNINDPTELINRIMSGYTQSDAYKAQRDVLGRELSNTAAAGGIAGTPLDQENQGNQIQKLLSGDMQQWLANALGVYNKGIEGEEGIAGRGFTASSNLADLISNALGSQATNAAQGQQQQNANQSGAFAALAKALASGAGWAAGGPAGALVGGGLGSSMFGGG